MRDDVARKLVEEHEAAAVRVHRVEGLAELLGVVVEVLRDRRDELVLRQRAVVRLARQLEPAERRCQMSFKYLEVFKVLLLCFIAF